ncbi:DnaJ-domain-containing protein [Jaminaea rosea]|uniref:DnaJ-domain-containing protein n=1 Tax=Jaminaea rosea TaxID=1569628 RepID=A0A316UIE9_9BASI|nr:DnaJ-domain-containing protein [Jaminaea rosea]PWN24999.1 DnaJ-domain-containing protein [Jaminaea rosea]
MRLFSLVALLGLLVLATAARAWEQTDYEIFDLQSSLEATTGKGTTFYSLLNLTSSATASEIKSAYRKRSVELHPDKHPQDPQASKRFEQLGLVIKILRDARKDRYDHFLSTGFPKWRGTGWYYVRWRPGFGTTLFFLVLIATSMELLVKRVNYSRDAKRIHQLQRAARFIAWGPRFYQIWLDPAAPVRAPAEKKVRVSLNAGASLPPPPAHKDVAAGNVDWDAVERSVKQGVANPELAPQIGGPALDLLVTREPDGESIVWASDDATGEWTELNEESALHKPTMATLWPARLAKHLVSGGRKGQDPASQPAMPEDASSAKSSAVKKSNAAAAKKGGRRK